MSFESAKNLFVKTIDSSEVVQCGKFSTAVDTEVKHMRIMIYIHNISIATERMRINVLPKYGHSTPIYSSDWADLSNISGLTTSWLGFIRFDFNNNFFDSDIDYFLELETDNYARNFDVSYLGAVLDSPLSINEAIEVPNNIPVGVEFYGFE